MSMGSKSTSLISRLIMSSMSFNLDFTAFSLNYKGGIKLYNSSYLDTRFVSFDRLERIQMTDIDYREGTRS
jgi:hypothetical protein